MKKSLTFVSVLIVLVAGPMLLGEEQGTTGRLRIGYRDVGASATGRSSETFRRLRRREAPVLLPLAVAKKQDLFAKHGVSVQIEAIPSSARSPTQDYDVLFGIGMPDFSDFKASPEEMRFMLPCAMTKDGDTIKALLVKKQAGIKDWADFKGKWIAVSSIGDVALFRDLILPKVGLRAEDVKLSMPVGSDIVRGFPTNAQLHAFYCDKVTMEEFLRDAPDELAVFATNLETEFIANPCYVSFVWLNWTRCRDKQEPLAALARALDEAIQQIRDNPAESAIALSGLCQGLDEKTAADLGVYWFQKSSEPCDFRALKRQFGKDLQPYYWPTKDASKP